MIKLENFKIPLKAIISSGKGIVVDVSKVFKWTDGQRTETQIGINYSVVFKELNFEKLNVKTNELKPVVTQEEIEANIEPIYISFDNALVSFYKNYRSGDYLVSVKADRANLVDEDGLVE